MGPEHGELWRDWLRLVVGPEGHTFEMPQLPGELLVKLVDGSERFRATLFAHWMGRRVQLLDVHGTATEIGAQLARGFDREPPALRLDEVSTTVRVCAIGFARGRRLG